MNIKKIYKKSKNHLFILLIYILCCLFYNEPSNDKYLIFISLIIFIQIILIKSNKIKLN
jgi:hypothetical protein